MLHPMEKKVVKESFEKLIQPLIDSDFKTDDRDFQGFQKISQINLDNLTPLAYKKLGLDTVYKTD